MASTAICSPAGQPSVRERSRRPSMGSRPRPASSSSCSTSTWVNARSPARSSVMTPASRSRDVENTGLCWLATSRRTWAGRCWATLCQRALRRLRELGVVDDDRGGAGRSARSRASESTSSGSSHEGRSRISAASLPMAGHRAARQAVSRDQNRAGSPRIHRRTARQPARLSSWPIARAGWSCRSRTEPPASTSGSPADSSLRSRAARCTRGPVARGTATSWLWTDMRLFGLRWYSPPGDLGRGTPSARPGAARFTLPRVIPG